MAPWTALGRSYVVLLSRFAPHLAATDKSTCKVSRPRHSRSLPRPLCHPSLSLLLLRLVGLLRSPHPPSSQHNRPLHPRHQFLGRRPLRPALLDCLLPLRRRQAAHHDGSAWRQAERRGAAISTVEGCRQGDLEEGRRARVLEGVRAVFFAGVPGKCNGADDV